MQLPSPGRKALSSAGPLCVQAQAGAAAPATLTLAPFTFLLFLYVHTGPARPVCGLLMLLFSSAVPARSIVPSGNYSFRQWPWAPPAQYLPHPLASPNAVPEPSDHISLCLFLASSLSHGAVFQGCFSVGRNRVASDLYWNCPFKTTVEWRFGEEVYVLLCNFLVPVLLKRASIRLSLHSYPYPTALGDCCLGLSGRAPSEM